MEMWTHNQDGEWKRWDHIRLGLETIVSADPRIDQVFLTESNPNDNERLLIAIRLTRHLAGGQVAIIAGNRHPSARWCEAVREVGANRTVLISMPENTFRPRRESIEDATELGDGICPELHVRQEKGIALSVCGRHQDRMVLARHHLDRWCLATKEDCPHWQGESHG